MRAILASLAIVAGCRGAAAPTKPMTWPALDEKLLADAAATYNFKLGVPAPLALAGLGYLLYQRGFARAQAGEPHSSLAALPCTNLSGDPAKDYFSDGMSEELLNLLARIPGLQVAARTSAFAYKGRNVDIREVGRELGVETVLERVRPVGINTITLAASYHAGKFVRPHGRSGKVYFPQDGTVYFKARPERYGHIRPLVNPLVEEFDAFALLHKHAPDLERCAWVVCLHNTPLGMQHPDLNSRNAFGDPYPYSLCPAHPAVRDYVVNLCADLADRYDIDRIVLETPGWLPYHHGFHHEFAMAPLDRFHKALLALDFSDAAVAAPREAGGGCRGGCARGGGRGGGGGRMGELLAS